MPFHFGDKIREARKTAGLTQRQLADRIKVSNTSISNWEKGVSFPDPDTIQHLCWALDVQPNYFFNVDTLSSAPPTIIAPTSSLSDEEQDIIVKYRCLDERGKSAVLNVLNHEYDSLPGGKVNSLPQNA